MEDAFDYASSGLSMLEIAAMAYETGRPDILERLSDTSFCYDEEYEFALDGMNALCDFMTEHSANDSEICTMYFSSNAMMEYYRLCREYGKLKGIPLGENPYMLKAKDHVREQMDVPDCYYCCYRLQTKINHKWASGLVFQYDCSYFCEYLALFSRLLYVFEFYDDMVKELRAEVVKLKEQNPIRALPAPAGERRAA